MPKTKFKVGDKLVLRAHTLKTADVLLFTIKEIDNHDRYICDVMDLISCKTVPEEFNSSFLDKAAIKFKKVLWYWEGKDVGDGTWKMISSRASKEDIKKKLNWKDNYEKFRPIYSLGFVLPNK